MSWESEALQKNMELMDERNQHRHTHHRLMKRALKAETNVATLRALVVDAKRLIERDYPLVAALNEPSRIKYWLQRAEKALEEIEEIQ